MSTALLFLITLVGMAPVVLFVDGPLILGMWCAVLAAALTIIGLSLRPGEGAHFAMLVRPLAILALLPAIFMLFQAIPLPVALRLDNPIWQSVEDALGRPLVGSVSIDIGATLLSLCRYLAWLALGLVASAVAIDRQRAEWILIATSVTTVVIAALSIFNQTGLFAGHDGVGHALTRGGALDGAMLGLDHYSAPHVRYARTNATKLATPGMAAVQPLD